MIFSEIIFILIFIWKSKKRVYFCKMNFKSNFFILYDNSINKQIKWPEQWGNTCMANLAPMLREVLNTTAIGSEIKYIKANCGSLHFQSKGTRKRALIALQNMGATNLICVDNYRDVLIYQAYFHNNKTFPNH